jgi:hypothetical protein
VICFQFSSSLVFSHLKRKRKLLFAQKLMRVITQLLSVMNFYLGNRILFSNLLFLKYSFVNNDGAIPLKQEYFSPSSATPSRYNSITFLIKDIVSSMVERTVMQPGKSGETPNSCFLLFQSPRNIFLYSKFKNLYNYFNPACLKYYSLCLTLYHCLCHD